MRSKKFLSHSPFIFSRQSALKYLPMAALTLALAACGSSNESKTTSTAADQPGTAQTHACGKVSIANMNWQSAEVLANIDKLILEKGFGCEVELVTGDTTPTTSSMTEKGKPDIAPELWLSAVKEPIEKAVKEGRLHMLSESLKDGGIEGFWIPKYFANKHPEIKTIDDALAHPELFTTPANPTRGVIYGCPSGWKCQTTTKQAFKAWDAQKKGFVLKDPGSAAGLDGSITKAYQRKQPWLGYYWAPTSILGKYEMVKLDAGVPFDAAEWDRCNINDQCPDPKKTDWEKSKVVTIVTDRFYKQGGQAVEYLRQRSWGNDTVNQLLAWMSDNQANGEDGAKYFLKNNPDVWTQWVTPQVAEKIKGTL